MRQLTSQQVFAEHCLGLKADPGSGRPAADTKELCFVAFLPHILDSGAKGRNEYLEVGSPRALRPKPC